MSPVEYFWAHQRQHLASKAEENKSATTKGKKKGVKVPPAIVKAQSVPMTAKIHKSVPVNGSQEETKESKTPTQYVIPVPDVSKSK